MPTVQIAANLSADQLLQAVKQLDTQELNSFANQVLALRARRQAPAVDTAEAVLLVRINEGLPDDLRRRYGELISRRQAETLNPEEHKELIRLSDHVEQMEAERLQALTSLARLRQLPLGNLMKQLGLNGKANG